MKNDQLTNPTGLLWRETSQRTHAAQWRGQVRHLVDVRVVALCGVSVATQESGCRDDVQVVILWRVSCKKQKLICGKKMQTSIDSFDKRFMPYTRIFSWWEKMWTDPREHPWPSTYCWQTLGSAHTEKVSGVRGGFELTPTALMPEFRVIRHRNSLGRKKNQKKKPHTRIHTHTPAAKFPKFRLTNQTQRRSAYKLTDHVLTWPFEHVQHPLCNQEATTDVDGRDESRQSGQCLDRVWGEVTTAHQQETAHGRDTRDGIGDRHQRGMESRGHTPDCVVTWEGQGTRDTIRHYWGLGRVSIRQMYTARKGWRVFY